MERWGEPGCEFPCSSKCQTTCNGKDGSCYCLQGYWGSRCYETCSNYCRLKGLSASACYQSNGYCDYCTAGWWGNRCQTRCSNQCTTVTCNKADGRCTCEPGYKPITCVNGRLYLNK